MAMPVGLQRVIAGGALLTTPLSLPVAATFIDTPHENWILPAAGAGAAVVGASVGATLPRAFGANISRLGAAGVGAGVGVGLAAAGAAALFFAIAG